MLLPALFVTLLLSVVNTSQIPEIGCRDENNQIVDWYYMIKLPRLKSDDLNEAEHYGKDEGKSDGDEYVFITSETVDESWKLSEIKVDDPNSMPGLTLSPIYDDSVKSIFIKYIASKTIHNYTTFSYLIYIYLEIPGFLKISENVSVMKKLIVQFLLHTKFIMYYFRSCLYRQ